MTTPTSKSEALWTTFKETNLSTHKKITDKTSEINEKNTSRLLKIQKYQESIALIEDVVERTESFLSTNNELTTMTQVVIGNEIGENKSRLERMKTELGRLEAEEAEERDLERDDYVRVDYDDV